MTHLWLIEGLPGSGKTSAAKRLDGLCMSRGLPSRWWLEEAKDHPILPSSLRKLSANPDFPQRCVEAFRKFVTVESGILIIEGSAFQNTVRFMFAHNRPAVEITAYVSAWVEAIKSARPRLLIFNVADPIAHYKGFVAACRGATWMETLIAYVEATPVAKARNWRGVDGLLEFWATYQELCLKSSASLPWPVHVMRAWSETGAFDEEAAFNFFNE